MNTFISIINIINNTDIILFIFSNFWKDFLLVINRKIFLN